MTEVNANSSSHNNSAEISSSHSTNYCSSASSTTISSEPNTPRAHSWVRLNVGGKVGYHLGVCIKPSLLIRFSWQPNKPCLENQHRFWLVYVKTKKCFQVKRYLSWCCYLLNLFIWNASGRKRGISNWSGFRLFFLYSKLSTTW
jgi:hypothetical protein